MKYSDSGWLFQKGDMSNVIHNVSEQDIFTLLDFAKEDDLWAERVRDEAAYQDAHPGSSPVELLLEQIRIPNIAGTVVSYPFGDAITFGSTRHFFRGERAVYDKTIPSLNRRITGMSLQEQELYRAVANMRIHQFSAFLWSLNITPRWTATLSDINYQALAQHYGFETHLLDLTNDFKTALFFATSRYDAKTDSYYPLTKKDIEQSERTQRGVIFHTPNWTIDYFQPMAMFESRAGKKFMGLDTGEIKREADSGDWDGIAFQIGFQPFMRCRAQSGFIFPMREKAPLQEDVKFEKLQFRQSPKLSEKIFELMDGGKKVFPFEGLSEARPILTAMQNSWTFSEDDLNALFELNQVDLSLFPNAEELKKAFVKWHFEGNAVRIIQDHVDYHITPDLIDRINAMYDSVDFGKEIGDVIHIKPEHQKRRDEIYAMIYGRHPDTGEGKESL